MYYFGDYASPFGNLRLVWSDAGLRSVAFLDESDDTTSQVTEESVMNPQALPDVSMEREAGCFPSVIDELNSYFNGETREFTVPLDYRDTGTAFQVSVWETLRSIPYGTTITYGELAQRIGNPKAARAVGLANNRNPLAIFIPCHRVLGANGSLIGYAGGLPFKRGLLELEGVSLKQQVDEESVRQRILTAGAEEFARVGFEGARIDRVAEQGGANKRMIYHHFGSKSGLYQEVIKRMAELGLPQSQQARLKFFDFLTDPFGTGNARVRDELNEHIQAIRKLQQKGKMSASYDATLLGTARYLMKTFGSALGYEEGKAQADAENILPVLKLAGRARKRLEPVITQLGD